MNLDDDGRYSFLSMPFGLVMSQDVFQQTMNQFLEGCPGTVGIADNIELFGRTKKEHDKNLHTLMMKAQDYRLVLNSEKCAIKTPGRVGPTEVEARTAGVPRIGNLYVAIHPGLV